MELVEDVPRAAQQRAAWTQTDERTRVDIALFNGFALPKVAAIIEIFQKANALGISHRSAPSRYDVSLLSAAGGRIASSSSVFIWTESVQSHQLTNDRRLLFIAGGAGAPHACRDERLVNWLRDTHPLSEIVHPIAEGRLLLEAAKLPSRYCALLYGDSETRGDYKTHPLTEAPTETATALRIVEEDMGKDVARLVAASVAPEGNAPFATSGPRNGAPLVSEKILESAHWLESNVDRPVSIDAAAQAAAMSERNFLRRFKSEIGMTPSDYLLRARLNLSCRMLLESHLPVDQIARRCGIGSGGQLAKLFRKYLETTPTDYRKLWRDRPNEVSRAQPFKAPYLTSRQERPTARPQ
jgi:transcriptional regulator GlxA family with amidase domain